MRILFLLLASIFLLTNFAAPVFANTDALHIAIASNPCGSTAFQNLYGIEVNPFDFNYYWPKLNNIAGQADYPGPITFVQQMVKAYELDVSIQAADISVKEAFVRVYGAYPAPPDSVYTGKLYDISEPDSFDPAAFISSLPSVVILHDATQAATAETKAAFTAIFGISVEAGFDNPYYTGLLFDIVGDDDTYDAIKADDFVGALENVVALHYALAGATETQKNAFGDIFGISANNTLNSKKEGLFFRNLPVTGKYTFEDPLTGNDYTWNDYDARAGDNAWLAMSQLQIYRQKYGTGYNPEKIELALAEKIARSAMDLIVPDAGIGGMLMKKDSNLISTENVISWYAAFKMLHEITGKTEYMGAINRMEEFLTYVFDAGSNTFTQSAVKDPDWVLHGVFATDCQTWAIAGLGPAKIDAMFGQGAAYNIWQATKDIVGRYDGGNLEGLTYSTGMNAISIEWTAGGIVAALKIADYYQSSNPAWSDEALQDAIDMRNGIEQYRVNLDADKSAFIYASDRVYLPFGWYTPPTDVMSTGSTAWVSFLASGFDPFVLGAQIPMFDSLPELVSIDNLMNWLPTTVNASYGLLSSYQVPLASKDAILNEIGATNNDDASAEAAFIVNGFNIYDEALALMSLYTSGETVLQALADNATNVFWNGFFGDFSNITDVTDTTPAEMLLYREALFNITAGSNYNQDNFLTALPKVISLHTALEAQGLRDAFETVFGIDAADQDPAVNEVYRGKLFDIAGPTGYNQNAFLACLPKAALLHEALVADTLQDLFSTVYRVAAIKQLPGNGDYIEALFGIVGTQGYELNKFISDFTSPFPMWYPNGDYTWIFPTGEAVMVYGSENLKGAIYPDMVYLEFADENFDGNKCGRIAKEIRPDGFTLLFLDYHEGTDIAGRVEMYERNSNFLDPELSNATLIETRLFDASGAVYQTQIEPGISPAHDALGRVISWKVKGVSKTHVFYHGDTGVFSRKIYTDLTTGNIIIYDYHENGKLKNVIDFSGWYAEYDTLGRIIKEIISASETVLYAYYEDYLRLTEKQVINTAAEHMTVYLYSMFGSIESKEIRLREYYDTSTDEYTYHEGTNQVKIHTHTDMYGNVILKEYDINGILVTEIDPENTWENLHEALGVNALRGAFEAIYGIPEASQDSLTNLAYKVVLFYITGSAGYNETDFISGLPEVSVRRRI